MGRTPARSLSSAKPLELQPYCAVLLQADQRLRLQAGSPCSAAVLPRSVVGLLTESLRSTRHVA
jgi:hypothetical protein